MSGVNTRRRQRRLTITWGASLLLGLVLGVLLQGSAFGLPTPFGIILGLGVLVALIIVQIYYWRTLDELARSIHMRAFFWGGLTTWIGLLCLIFIAPIFPAEAARVAQMGAFNGAILVIAVHALLYLLLWAWHWLKPR